MKNILLGVYWTLREYIARASFQPPYDGIIHWKTMFYTRGVKRRPTGRLHHVKTTPTALPAMEKNSRHVTL